MTTISLPDGSRCELVDGDGNQTVFLPRGKLRPPPPGRRRGETAWYVPYTAVHAATLNAAPRDAVWVDVSTADHAYFAALLAIWGRGETFAVVEHDVVCRPDVVKEFEECPELWCCFGYSDICCQDETGFSPCMEAWRNLLGCTRFRKELIEAVPDAMSSIPSEGWDWHNMCDGLGNNLRAAGFSHHWHFPPVEHHRETHRI